MSLLLGKQRDVGVVAETAIACLPGNLGKHPDSGQTPDEMIGSRVGHANQISDLGYRDDRMFEKMFEHPMSITARAAEPIGNDRAMVLAQSQDPARSVSRFSTDLGDPG